MQTTNKKKKMLARAGTQTLDSLARCLLGAISWVLVQMGIFGTGEALELEKWIDPSSDWQENYRTEENYDFLLFHFLGDRLIL